MLMGVKCLDCQEDMIMSDVISGKYPIVKTMWSCSKHGAIEVTHMNDEAWKKQYKN